MRREGRHLATVVSSRYGSSQFCQTQWFTIKSSESFCVRRVPRSLGTKSSPQDKRLATNDKPTSRVQRWVMKNSLADRCIESSSLSEYVSSPRGWRVAPPSRLFQKCFYDCFSGIQRHQTLANRYDIRIVMLPRQTCHFFGQTICRSNTRYFIGGNRNANATSWQYAQWCVTAYNGDQPPPQNRDNLQSLANVCESPQRCVSISTQKVSKFLFIAEARVVGADCDGHSL